MRVAALVAAAATGRSHAARLQAEAEAQLPWRHAGVAAGALAWASAAGAQMMDPRKANELMLVELFRDMDANSDGRVCKQEHMDYALDRLDEMGAEEKMVRKSSLQFSSTLYDVADIDEDGFLNPYEVEYAEYLTRQASHCSTTKGCKDHFGVDKAEATFTSFDTDGSGAVNRQEFDAGVSILLERLGMDRDMVDPTGLASWTRDMFTKADVVGDGELEMRELQYACFVLKELTLWDIAVATFQIMDTNHDLRVTREEVDAAIADFRRRIGHHPRSVPELIGEYFDEFDENGDKYIEVSEGMQVALRIQKTIADDF